MNKFNATIYNQKDIKSIVDIINNLEKIYIFIGGDIAFDEIETNIINNIFVIGKEAVVLNDILGINIFTSIISDNYGLFDIIIFSKNKDIQISIPYDYENNFNEWVTTKIV